MTLTWWCGDSIPYDGIICDGAVRSGKTICMGLSFFCWAMRCYDGQSFGLCGKTAISLRRNLVAPLVATLRSLGFVCTEKLTQKCVVVSFGGRCNTFYLFGGKDEGSASLIQGMTLAGILLDEVVLMPRSFVEQGLARCSVEGAKFWFSCNPEGPEHWFYKEWIAKKEARRMYYLHFTMEDNPSLSPALLARYGGFRGDAVGDCPFL